MFETDSFKGDGGWGQLTFNFVYSIKLDINLKIKLFWTALEKG